ncbi:uncharacterized protein [Aquarana catesbeiana]|uniref:uncharacterized protein n=1 Tax=Aquarana catesbeiana TaxID=8400 RepID=UPI003CC9BA48
MSFLFYIQSGNLRDPKVEVKEEIKEQDDEDGVMEDIHKDLYQDTMVESSSYRNPPERCPRPLYSRDSTQEGHTIPHCYKGEDLIDIKVEVKSEEEEERYVRDDQQSMEEDGITGTFIEEDTPTEISTAQKKGELLFPETGWLDVLVATFNKSLLIYHQKYILSHTGRCVHSQKCLQWAHKNHNWTMKPWKKVAWSEEFKKSLRNTAIS